MRTLRPASRLGRSSSARPGRDAQVTLSAVHSRRPLVAIGVLIVAGPEVQGLWDVRGWVIHSPIELFGLGFEVPSLIFPLAASMLSAVYVLPLINDGYIVHFRTRANFLRQLRSLILRTALTAFCLVSISVFLWWIVCFVVDPAVRFSSDFGQGYDVAGGAGSRTFSQLVEFSPVLYGVLYSSWLGAWAAYFAAITTTLLLVVPRPALVLVLPLALYWAENVILANLQLEQFRLGAVLFPWSMQYQSAWTALVPTVVWILIGALVRQAFVRTRGQTAPLL